MVSAPQLIELFGIHLCHDDLTDLLRGHLFKLGRNGSAWGAP